MRYYYAPLEGITDATFRTLHHKYFPGVDRYFMPFISPTIHRCLTNREARELPKADSVPFTAVPQLLGKNVEDMLWALEVCRDLGYDEVNINLGCPSGTVVSKGKVFFRLIGTCVMQQSYLLKLLPVCINRVLVLQVLS